MRWLLLLLVASLAVVACIAAPKKLTVSYYELLDVSPDASPKDIKKAFYALAMKIHPDKNQEHKDRKKLEEKYATVNKAYDVLSDPTKRERYDKMMVRGIFEYDEEKFAEEDARIKQEEQRIERLKEQQARRRAQFEAEQMAHHSSATFEEPEDEGFQGGVELLSKVGAAIGVVLAFVVAGYVFKSIRPAPASRPSSADLRQDISRKHNERVQNDIQDQEREARKERERERRRELIMAQLAEQRIEEERVTRWQSEEDEQAQLDDLLEDMVIDEEKVTKWEGDEEEQQRLEEALREAEGDMKTEKGAKSLLSLDDNTDISSFPCEACGTVFKTAAQLSSHFKSKKHLKNLKAAKRSEKSKAQAHVPGDGETDEADAEERLDRARFKEREARENKQRALGAAAADTAKSSFEAAKSASQFHYHDEDTDSSDESDTEAHVSNPFAALEGQS